MLARRKVMLSFIILVVILMGMYLFTDWFSKTLGYFTGEPQKIRLLNCMNDNGVIFYYADNCPDCLRQMELFEDNLKIIENQVNCDDNPFICKNLAGVPAWQIDEIYYGFKEIEELAQISGCVE